MNVVLRDPEADRRYQTVREEWANSVSHGLGTVAAVVGAFFLLRRAAERGASMSIGAAVFIAAVIFTYLASTLYHALPRGRAKHVLRIVEHMAIFILIAGTYTPFTLGVLRGPLGWALLGLIWFAALFGIGLKAFGGVRFPVLAALLYLAMGWLVVVAIKPLWMQMPHWGFLWIVVGGLAYTGGILFYAIDYRVRYSHFVWHLFVMAGTVCHFIAVYAYA
jgi:hemolysin III